jgi:hypothetical protein
MRGDQRQKRSLIKKKRKEEEVRGENLLDREEM